MKKAIKTITLALLIAMMLQTTVLAANTSTQDSKSQAELESEVDEILENGIRETIKESNQKTTHDSDSTRWIPDESRTTTLKFTVNPGEVKKFEVFYNSDSTISPKLVFMSPNNQIINRTEDIMTAEVYIINRNDYMASNYPDMKYDNIYIAPLLEEYAGEWTVSVTIDESIKEFVLLECKADEGWENFVEEYKSTPIEVKLWYLESANGYFGVNDIKALCLRDDKIPESNKLAQYVEPPKEKKSSLPALIILIIIAIAGLITGIIVIYKKMQQAAKEKREYEIFVENKKLKKRKKIENDKLSTYLNNYTKEYTDKDVLENAGSVDAFLEEEEKEFTPVVNKDSDTVKIKATIPQKRPSNPNNKSVNNKKGNKQTAKNSTSAKNTKQGKANNQAANKPNVPSNKPVAANMQNNTAAASNNGSNTQDIAQTVVQTVPIQTVGQIPINIQGMPMPINGNMMLVNGQLMAPVYTGVVNPMPGIQGVPINTANPMMLTTQNTVSDNTKSSKENKDKKAPSWAVNSTENTKWQKNNKKSDKNVIF